MDDYLTPPRKRTHLELMALIFTIVALVATFAADILSAGALAQTVGVDAKNMNSDELVTPPGWREAMFVGLLAVIGGAIYCGSHGAFTKWRRGAAVSLVILLVWMGLHTVVAFSSGFQLFEIVHFKGPATWIGLLAIVLGQYKNNWSVIEKCMVFFSYLVSAIILYSIATVVVADRFDAMRAVFGYMQILQYPALWMMLSAFSRNRLIFSIFPFLVYALSSMIVVTRSLVLSCVLYLIAALYLGYKYRISKGRQRVIVYSILALTLAVVVVSVVFESRLLDAAEMLVARLDDDSRSDQYEQFLSQIDVFDVLVGRGIRGVWVWNGVEYPSIDGSYTLLMFTGGIPLLVTYVIVMFWSAYRCLKVNAPLPVATSAVTVMFWALALTGFGIYAVPSFRFSHVVLCLMVGLCIRYLSDLRQARLMAGRYAGQR